MIKIIIDKKNTPLTRRHQLHDGKTLPHEPVAHEIVILRSDKKELEPTKMRICGRGCRLYLGYREDRISEREKEKNNQT